MQSQGRTRQMRRSNFLDLLSGKDIGAAFSDSQIKHVIGMRSNTKMRSVDTGAIIASMQNVLMRLKAPANGDLHRRAMGAQSYSTSKRHVSVAVVREPPRPNSTLAAIHRACFKDSAKIVKVVTSGDAPARKREPAMGSLSSSSRHPSVLKTFQPSPRSTGSDGLDGASPNSEHFCNCGVSVATRDLLSNVKNLGGRKLGLVMSAASTREATLSRFFRVLFVSSQTKVRDLHAMGHVAVVKNHHSIGDSAARRLPKNAGSDEAPTLPANLRVTIPSIDRAHPKTATIYARRAMGVYRANRAAVLRVARARLVNVGADFARFWSAVFDYPMLPHVVQNGVIVGSGQ